MLHMIKRKERSKKCYEETEEKRNVGNFYTKEAKGVQEMITSDLKA